MSTYDGIADLPLTIESYEVEGRARHFSGFSRLTTTFHLHGGGEAGMGEDVTYDSGAQQRQIDAGPVLPLAGEYTVRTFSDHLATLDLFHGGAQAYPGQSGYRVWGVESAALDLALRQAGRPLHEALGREARPLRFVASIRISGPEPVAERIAAYPGARFKLDPEPGWSPELIDALVATGAVDVMDFKGLYKDTPVDVDTDPELYRVIAERFPSAWLEDPDLTVPEADAALEPHRDRITWDAAIHSVQDVLDRPFAPKALNCKPSRFGTIESLFDFYDHCEREGIGLYGGGQSELGVGRGQIQLLAAIFHPDGSNDVAPSGWDHEEWPRTGLPTSPLDPAPAATGFRRRDDA